MNQIKLTSILLFAILTAGCTSAPALTTEEQAYMNQFNAIHQDFNTAFDTKTAEWQKYQDGITTKKQFLDYYQDTYLTDLRTLKDRTFELQAPTGYSGSHTKLTLAIGGHIQAAEMVLKGFQDDNAVYITQATPVQDQAFDDLDAAVSALKAAQNT